MQEITIHQPGEITTAAQVNDYIPQWHRNLDARVKAQELTEDTAKGYKTGVTRFTLWLSVTNERPDPDAIRQWKAELLKKYKPSSVNAWLAGVRSFFTWLAERGQIPFNPTQAVKGATRKGSTRKHRREQLTNAEARAILSTQRTTPEEKRNHAIIATMLYTAARTVEIYRADLADLRTESGKLVLYIQGKGHAEKDDLLVITGQAETAIMDWLAERGTEPGPLFTSLSDRSAGGRLSRRAIRGIVKSAFRAAGVHGNKTTHSLRHTAITSAIRAGGDPLKVKAMSRHASVDTLMIYYHEVDRTDNPAEELIDYSK